MKKNYLLIVSICLLLTACTKSNKIVIQTETKQIEESVSLYEHILDIGDDIQIMSDTKDHVLITKFNENKQIVIICDADNERYMSQRHCEDSFIYLFTKRNKDFNKQVEWIGVLDNGANRYASKIVEEYDEYYKKTFTRVYTTYESLYGWLNE